MSINGVQDRDTLWIGGDWVPSDGGGSIEVISPHTEQVIATVPEASTADVDNAVAAARAALESGPWATMDPAGRAEILTNLTGALGGRAEDLAQTITAEMGSPIMFSHLGQVGATLMVADYYANLAKDFTFEEERQGLMSSVLVRREPVGVVGAIVPWNVPLYVTMLKLAPALAAGATMVLKPAPESPLSAYLLAEALEEVGLPKGVVNVLPAGREVGEHLVRHPGVDKIAFTGSTAAGMKIASICGEQLKRYTLELGGKSAAIILDDADVDTTLDNLLQVAGLMNNGQACVAQTRVLASTRQVRRGRQRPGHSHGGGQGRRPGRDGHRGRAPRRRAPAGPGREVHRAGSGGGCGGRRGRRSPRRPGHGLVRRAHPLRQGHQRHAHRPGGDLRAGHLGHPLRRRRRRRGHRQRLDLRPVGLGLDRGRRGRPRHRQAGPHRHVQRERLHARALRPVRRVQAVRRGREGGPEGLAAYLEDKAINRF